MEARAREVALLWLLNLSDGGHSLLDISDRSGIEFDVLRDAADALVQSDLLKEGSPNENATGSSPREPAR
jgi:aminopeptidase-like protein